MTIINVIYHVYSCIFELKNFFEIQVFYLLLTSIFIGFYVASKLSKDKNYASYFHMHLHILGVCGNMIFYFFVKSSRNPDCFSSFSTNNF